MSIERDIVDAKLPLESEHFDALERMRTLDAYYDWSLSLFKSWVGSRVLDAGCGIGNGTAILADHAEFVMAADLSTQNIEFARNRFSGTDAVEAIQLDLEDDFSFLTTKRFDTILCMDVLEHVADDVGLLKRFYDIAQPGGHLLVKVPAIPWLYGSVDRASGHFRRYSRKSLESVASRAGWDSVTTSYMNLAGVAPYFWKSRVLKKATNLSRTYSPRQLNRIRRLIPLLRKADKILGPPLGQSVIIVAKKPTVPA